MAAVSVRMGVLAPPLVAALLLLPADAHAAEGYSERLALRRLPAPPGLPAERSALATFSFAAALNATGRAAAQHAELFPVAMAQLMQAHRLSELRLSMSGGHWEEGWGGAALVPPGVALWISTPRAGGGGAGAEEAWDGASAAVAGLFCPALAALRFEDTSAPALFRGGIAGRAGEEVLHAAKPQEVMCHDHLRTFVRLLPCGSGGSDARNRLVSSLAHVLALANSRFLSVELVLRAAGAGGAHARSYDMSLVVQAVLHGDAAGLQRPGSSFAELDGSFLSVPVQQAALPGCCLCRRDGVASSVMLHGGAPAAFELQPHGGGNDESFRTALASFWSAGAQQGAGGVPRLDASVAQAANGYRGCSLVYELANPMPRPVLLVLRHTVPWALQLRLSSLRATLRAGDAAHWQSTTVPELGATRLGSGSAQTHGATGLLAALVHPSQSRGNGGTAADWDASSSPRRSPTALELVLRLPPNCSALVSLAGDRSFLRFADFPPDAARGVDLPAPMAAYYLDAPDNTAVEWLQSAEPAGVVYAPVGLVLPIAWPDFSMPYNVICISCTLPMVVFGAVTAGVIEQARPNPARRACWLLDSSPPCLLVALLERDGLQPRVGGRKPRPMMAFVLWFLRLCDQLFGG